MRRNDRNAFGCDEKQRDLRDKATKAARIGAIVVLTAIAVIGIRLIFASANSQTFSLDKEAELPIEAETSPSEATNEDASARESAIPSDSSSKEQMLAVYVSGAVASPGVYEVPVKSRVVDAVEAAGGLADDAAPDAVNLARPINDGEQIHIPHAGDPEQSAVQPASGGEASASLVNINTADASALESLPGVGPSTAQKIIAEREANGPFQSVDDLTRVSGIGAKKLEALRDSACA